MPEPFRLIWSDRALTYLEQLAERAPGQAAAVVTTMEWLAASGFALGPEVRPGIRYWPVPPQGVYYAPRGRDLHVARVVDVRRRRSPHP
jgi:hypothetical protein